MAPPADPSLDKLLARLALTAASEPDHFEGPPSSEDGVDATFGGHFLGQAVVAANATVEQPPADEHQGRYLHSLHAYFLRGGRPGESFDIEVDRVRDGRSFCTRRVRTCQDPGKLQFELLASYAAGAPESDTPELAPRPAIDLDDLPRPEDLPSYGELMRSLDPLPLPEEWAFRDYGLDIRTIAAPWAPDGPTEHHGLRFWVRAKPGLVPSTNAGTANLHAALLAYQSDESLADCVAVPWGKTWGSPDVVFVSLDHAMWIHRPVDLDQWLLFDQEPIVVARERGLATASVWTADGQLVASVRQEALLRLGELRLGDG